MMGSDQCKSGNVDAAHSTGKGAKEMTHPDHLNKSGAMHTKMQPAEPPKTGAMDNDGDADGGK